jgi:hypothetical protein
LASICFKPPADSTPLNILSASISFPFLAKFISYLTLPNTCLPSSSSVDDIFSLKNSSKLASQKLTYCIAASVILPLAGSRSFSSNK